KALAQRKAAHAVQHHLEGPCFVKRQRSLINASALAVVALTLMACDKPATPDSGTAAAGAASAATAATGEAMTPRAAYEAASKGSGFTTGPVMAANTVYVFFDPTCPHCAALWTN